MTWPVGVTTQPIPTAMRGKQILDLFDNTNMAPGVPGTIVQQWQRAQGVAGFYVVDMDTWGWAPAPTSDLSLAIYYMATPAELKHESDEPVLFPPNHHELIGWSAAVHLQSVAAPSEAVPRSWVDKQAEQRYSLWKTLTRGSPIQTPPKRIQHQYGDAYKV
jgi:hypothetical protein